MLKFLIKKSCLEDVILQKLHVPRWHLTSCNHSLLSISQLRFSAGGSFHIHMCPSEYHGIWEETALLWSKG